jgi:hypothetical protein
MATSTSSTTSSTVATTIPATTSSTTLPATTTSTTTTTTNVVDPVAVALNRLSKTALQNLWDDKITNRGFFGKISGFFEYLYNRSTAAAEDTQEAVATIEKFNKATTELVEAVAARHLNSKEVSELDVGQGALNYKAQLLSAQVKIVSEEKLTAFYEAFKERVSATQLNIAENSDEFGAFGAAAEKAIRDFATGKKVTTTIDGVVMDISKTLAPRIETTLTEFKTKIFNDMKNGYAEQDLANITPESLQKKVELIKGYFKWNDTREIRAELVKAIKAHHDSSELAAKRAEFIAAINNTGSSDIYVASKEARKTTLEARQTALETELAEFRGTNGFNGTLNAADKAQRDAQADVNQLYIDFFASFGTPMAGLTANNQAGIKAAWKAFVDNTPASSSTSTPVNVSRLAALFTKIEEAERVLQEKKDARKALQDRFDEIAVYNNTGNLSGGELSIVKKSLADAALNDETVKELRNLANFYGSLNDEINEGNMDLSHSG